MRLVCNRLWLALIGASACADENHEVDPAHDAQVDIALDAQVDGGLDARMSEVPDASADATQDADVIETLDARVKEPYVDRTGYSCALDQEYRFSNKTPPTPFLPFLSYRITAGGRFAQVSADWRFSTSAECALDLPACGGERVDGVDLAAAFTAPAVLDAFAANATVGEPVVGYTDPRWEVTRADGKTITFGSPCSDGPDCVAVEPALPELLNLLFRLRDENTFGALDDGGFGGSCRSLR